jgi:hypothetical protein
MGKLVLLVLAGLALGACGPRISTAQRDQLLAAQAVLNERIKAGQITEAEAKLIYAKMAADMASDWSRTQAIMNSGGGVSVYQPVGGGTYIRY